ncbi:hypothetical protein N657DRAFT_649946 [Parathielavia appendiculata]|uniref:Uncharacterized protein n=1 Tax=Parathielavia appendiculata TaxID=2587402 RepID=A0AAN6TS28_9PEZI|nr:hypothetical protein N657DRAFT_649946 [Parathielavia appendiculata]
MRPPQSRQPPDRWQHETVLVGASLAAGCRSWKRSWGIFWNLLRRHNQSQKWGGAKTGGSDSSSSALSALLHGLYLERGSFLAEQRSAARHELTGLCASRRGQFTWSV